MCLFYISFIIGMKQISNKSMSTFERSKQFKSVPKLLE